VWWILNSGVGGNPNKGSGASGELLPEVGGGVFYADSLINQLLTSVNEKGRQGHGRGVGWFVAFVAPLVYNAP
jgi:hypothetical protein